ncbi:hypothetical protein AB4084_36990, partial [Lysobacter sp. 2RAB21]
VYDYANLAALGAYVESQLPAPSAMPAKQAHMQAIARIASVAKNLPAVDAVAHPAPASSSAPAARAERPGIDALQSGLRKSLAQALYLDEAAIDS